MQCIVEFLEERLFTIRDTSSPDQDTAAVLIETSKFIIHNVYYTACNLKLLACIVYWYSKIAILMSHTYASIKQVINIFSN